MALRRPDDFGTLSWGWAPALLLLLALPALVATFPRETPPPTLSAPGRIPSHADSTRAAGEVCRSLVRERLDLASGARFQPFEVRWDRYSRKFIGRGVVTVPAPVGDATPHPFVCIVDPRG